LPNALSFEAIDCTSGADIPYSEAIDPAFSGVTVSLVGWGWAVDAQFHVHWPVPPTTESGGDERHNLLPVRPVDRGVLGQPVASWRTRAHLELAVVEYIGWFNDGRLHQALGDLPPSEFEQMSQSSSLEISLS
jgi:Integrase core domain